MTPLGRAVVGLVVLTAASGCAAPGATPAASPTRAANRLQQVTATPTGTGPAYLGPLPSPTTYPDAGISLTPPGPDVPSQPWTVVFASHLDVGGPAVHGQRPTVTLARATSLQAGTARADGSTDPLMDRTLVYVLHWTGLSCEPAGPAPGPGTQTPRAPTTCDSLQFVDAQTGADLYGSEWSLH